MSRQPDEWADDDMLYVMHLIDNNGFTRGAAGQRVGRSKGAVIGMLDRVRRDTNATDNGNQNGTMKPMWWKR